MAILTACSAEQQSDVSQKPLAGKEVLLLQHERLPNLEQLEQEILARPALSAVKVRRVTLPFEMGPYFDQRIAEEISWSQPDLIYTQTPNAFEVVVKKNTKRIPVVFLTVISLQDTGVTDEKGVRLPGLEHVTGLAVYAPAHAKHLEVMQDAYPGVRKVGILVDQYFNRNLLNKVLQEFPEIKPVFLEVGQKEPVESVTEKVKAVAVDAWYFPQTAYLQQNSQALAGAMRKLRIRGMYGWHVNSRHGGAISMQAAIPDRDKRHAEQIELILSGTRPSDIAIETASTLRVAVNSTAVAELGAGFNREFLKFVDIFY